MSKIKTFLLLDDDSPDIYVGRFSRTDEQIIPALQKLEIGDWINTGPGRSIQREE